MIVQDKTLKVQGLANNVKNIAETPAEAGKEIATKFKKKFLN